MWRKGRGRKLLLRSPSSGSAQISSEKSKKTFQRMVRRYQLGSFERGWKKWRRLSKLHSKDLVAYFTSLFYYFSLFLVANEEDLPGQFTSALGKLYANIHFYESDEENLKTFVGIAEDAMRKACLTEAQREQIRNWYEKIYAIYQHMPKVSNTNVDWSSILNFSENRKCLLFKIAESRLEEGILVENLGTCVV